MGKVIGLGVGGYSFFFFKLTKLEVSLDEITAKSVANEKECIASYYNTER